MTGAGQVPATADDITFSYPKGSFDSQAAIMKLAESLEDLTLGRLSRRCAERPNTAAEAPDRTDRSE